MSVPGEGYFRKRYIIYIHQYCIYPAIKFAKKNVIQFNSEKKDNGNPIDTSIVVPVRGVA